MPHAHSRTAGSSATVVVLAVLAVVLAGCGAAAPPSRAPVVADGWWAAWNGDDPTRLGALFTEDATYRDLAVGKASRGRDGVTEWKRRTDANIAEVHVTPVAAFGEGDSVAVQSTYSGRLQGAPRPFRVPMVTVLHLRGDLVADDADYYDVADILRQSGLPADWTPPTT